MEGRLSGNMVVPLLALCLGIVLADLGVPLIAGCVLLPISVLLNYLLLRLSANPVRAFRFAYFHYFWIAMLFCGTGIIIYNLQKPTDVSHVDEDEVVAVKGRITEITTGEYGERAVVSITSLIYRDGSAVSPYNIKLLLRSDAIDARVGDIIVSACQLSRITEDPNRFDNRYVSVQRRQGVVYKSTIASDQIQIIGHRESVSSIAVGLRDNLVRYIEHSGLDRKTCNFLITVLLGDRDYLDPAERDLFSQCGVAHILALSGMHIAIIGGIFMFLLFPLNFRGWYRQRLVITLLLMFGYAFVTGMAYSTVRACLMLTFVTVGILIERKHSSWNALLTSLLLILIISPDALFDIGLQLSALSVAAMIIFMGPLNTMDLKTHPRLHKVVSAILSTLVTTLATWCLSAFYFGSFPLMFLPANLIVLPILPIYIVVAISALILHAVPTIGPILIFVTDWGFAALHRLLEFISDGGNSALSLYVSTWSLLLWFAVIILLALVLYHTGKYRKTYIGAAGTLTVLTVISIFYIPHPNEGETIVRNHYRTIETASIIDGQEVITRFENNAISLCHLPSSPLIVVDCKPTEELPEDERKNPIVVLCGGFEGSMQDVKELYHPAIVLIHPSVFAKREEKLQAESEQLHIPIHSLRTSPYRILN